MKKAPSNKKASSGTPDVPEAYDEETARLYAGMCCFCKFFRGAYERTKRKHGHWVDDPGWCVRYPPVFIGGEIDDAEDVDFSRFKQPGVLGFDECGEFVQMEATTLSTLMARKHLDNAG